MYDKMSFNSVIYHKNTKILEIMVGKLPKKSKICKDYYT